MQFSVIQIWNPSVKCAFPILFLPGKKVVEVGVGCMHVVILTEDGEVYVWGRNDQAQLGDSPHAAVPEPTLLSALQGKSIIGIACGPSQVMFLLK